MNRPKQFLERDCPVIRCASGDITCIQSSNGILKLKNNIVDGFFCVCRKHDALENYVKEFIRDYYCVFHTDEDYLHDYNNIIKSLNISDNFKKFIHENAWREFCISENPSVIGICLGSASKDSVERLKEFLKKYAGGQLFNYKINKFLSEKKYQTFTTNKSMAFQAVAELLNIQDILPKARYVKLVINEKHELFGLLTDSALGENIHYIAPEIRRKMITPEFQRIMSISNVLDVICHEMDHQPNNYRVIVEEDSAVGLSLFDNNGIGTFSLDTRIDFTTYKDNSPYVKFNAVNRPHLDKNVAERIFSIQFIDLWYALGKYLPVLPIFATWIRLKNLQKAILFSKKKSSDFLLEKHEWSTETINEELTGKYGKTYLFTYLYDCYVNNLI